MECQDLEAALEWANRLPTYGYVEVEVVMQYGWHAAEPPPWPPSSRPAW